MEAKKLAHLTKTRGFNLCHLLAKPELRRVCSCLFALLQGEQVVDKDKASAFAVFQEQL